MDSKKKTKGLLKIAKDRKIEKKSHLQVTFTKRRQGLFKKADELSVLCGADIAVIVRSPAGKIFSLGGPSEEAAISRYLAETAGTCNWWERPIDGMGIEELGGFLQDVEKLRAEVMGS